MRSLSLEGKEIQKLQKNLSNIKWFDEHYIILECWDTTKYPGKNHIINIESIKRIILQNKDLFDDEALHDTKKWLINNKKYLTGNPSDIYRQKKYWLLSGFPRKSVDTFPMRLEYREKLYETIRSLNLQEHWKGNHQQLEKRAQELLFEKEPKYQKLLEEKSQDYSLGAIIVWKEDESYMKKLLSFNRYRG